MRKLKDVRVIRITTDIRVPKELHLYRKELPDMIKGVKLGFEKVGNLLGLKLVRVKVVALK